MNIKTVAKTAVLNGDHQVLLLRRSLTDNRRPGEQDFPGGGVDPGEDLAQAAAREIQEEAGIVIKPDALALLYAATELYETKSESVTRLLFVAHVERPDIVLSHEHDEYQWQPIEKALELFPHPFYGAGLQYAFEHGLLQ